MSRQATSSAVVLAVAMIMLLLGWLPPVAAHQTELPPPDPKESTDRDHFDEIDVLIAEGSYAEAESRAREVLALEEATWGENSLEVALVLDLLVQSMWRGGKADQPEVLEMAERAVEIKEAQLGPDAVGLADSLTELSNVLHAQQEYESQDPILERALAIYESALGPDDIWVGNVLQNHATSLWRRGQYDRAQAMYERQLAIVESARGPDHPDVASVLESIANMRTESGEGEFIPLYERALAIREAALGPDHPLVGLSLSNLGLYVQEEGDYLRAKQMLERSLAIRENRLGKDHPDVAATLTNLGILYGVIGDLMRGAEFLRRAVSIASASSDRFGEGVALGNLGISVENAGDYMNAIRHYERARMLFEETFGPQHLRVVWMMSTLGDAMTLIGNYGGARTVLEEALKILDNTVGGDHWLAPGIHESLGEIEQAIGDDQEAEGQFERAVEIAKKAYGPSGQRVAGSLIAVAAFHEEIGDTRAAKLEYERALAIYRDAVGASHPKTTPPLEGLARVARAEKNTTLAIARYERALEILEETWGSDHPGIAATLSGLAEAQVAAGNDAEAFSVALQAEQISRAHLRVATRGLAERQALRYASVRVSGLDVVLSLAADDPSPARAAPALDSLIRSRAVVLDEMARRHGMVAMSDDPEVAALAAELAAARSWLAHLTVRGADDLEPEQYREILAAAQEEKEFAERELASLGMSEETLTASERAGLEEVSASILPGEAVVAFARYERHSSKLGGDALQESPDPVPSYAVFILRGGQATPTLVDLGDAEVIDGLVLDVQRQMARVSEAPEMAGKREETAYRRVAGALRAKVWDPVAPSLKGTTKVLVVPDGGLNLVSFAALPVGESKYLIEGGMEILYLSAERDLALASASPIGAGMVALGNPAFDRTELVAGLAAQGTPAGTTPHREEWTYRGPRSSCGDFRAMRFEPLPASAGELNEVVALWNAGDGGSERASRLRGASALRNDVVRLDGAAAGEAAFKAAAPGRRGLHLATHGFFLGGSCASALDPGVDEAVVHEDRNLAENPLLLSGFALAGANLREEAGAGEEDGILTAEEIASIDLSGVEWAVLSACNTGAGEIRAGEGVFGLRRAFRVAGVETLIMSLWPVEDEASRSWMNDFYSHRFQEGLGIADAVHTASLETLRSRRAEGKSTHPFFWAAFVAAGR